MPMYYLLNGYRFITPTKIEKFMKWMQIKYAFIKTSGKQILMVELRN